MDGRHGGDSVTARNRGPFMEREDTFGSAGLNLVRQFDSSTWDFEVGGHESLLFGIPTEKKRI